MAEPSNSTIRYERRIQDTPSEDQNKDLASAIEEWASKSFDLLQLPDLINDVKADDLYSQYHGAIGIRNLLSQEPFPIQEIINAGLIPRFFEFLENHKETDLQVLAAQILSQLLSGTSQQIQTIIDLGGLSTLLKLLEQPYKDLSNKTVLAIGNIAGDSSKYRDMLLNQGTLEYIVKILATTEDNSIIKDATWVLLNLCRGKPAPEPSKVSAAIPVLCGVIKMDANPETTFDALLALRAISEAKTQIQAIIATGVITSLIKHLKGGDEGLLKPCLGVVGNILNGNDEQTAFVVSFPDFLPQLFQLAQHTKNMIRREVCWIVSNITGGNNDQVSLVINNLQYVQVLIKIALTDDADVQKEAIWALSNATAHSNPSQIPQIIKIQIFDCLIGVLKIHDSKLLKVALKGIDNILSKWEDEKASQSEESNEFLTRLEEKGGLDWIEALQSHPDHDVYKAAVKILEKNFELEEQPM